MISIWTNPSPEPTAASPAGFGRLGKLSAPVLSRWSASGGCGSARRWPTSHSTQLNMIASRFKFVALIGFAGILPGDSRALADGVRWDFAGTLYSVSGVGSSQPGVSVGATVTGSITLPDAAAVYVSSSYPYWAGGTTTVFGEGNCNLDYTVASGKSLRTRLPRTTTTSGEVQVHIGSSSSRVARECRGQAISQVSWMACPVGSVTAQERLR